MKKVTTLILLAAASMGYSHDNSSLEERVSTLEKELMEFKEAVAPLLAENQVQQFVAEQQALARKRMRKDSQVYSTEELREIENLYQVANRNWNSEEGKDSLMKLISQYDQANRTGCALLYLGQMSEGKLREDYLARAIADYGDCFYGDGVQVGAYARYVLANSRKEIGENEKAKALFAEIEARYPHAIDHGGRLLSQVINE